MSAAPTRSLVESRHSQPLERDDGETEHRDKEHVCGSEGSRSDRLLVVSRSGLARVSTHEAHSSGGRDPNKGIRVLRSDPWMVVSMEGDEIAFMADCEKLTRNHDKHCRRSRTGSNSSAIAHDAC